jgi:hypothetical protein
MFQCLVIRISLLAICYFHAQARYIFLSHDSQAWPPGHVCGVRAGFSNIPGVPSADSLVSFYITVRRSGEMNGCAYGEPERLSRSCALLMMYEDATEVLPRGCRPAECASLNPT